MRIPSLLLAFAAAALFTASAAQSRRPAPLQHPQQASASKSESDQTAWEGSYTFQEGGGRSGGAGTFVEHAIIIYLRGSELIADIDADGFQTSRRLRCTVKVEADRISLYFSSYREDNVFEPYRKGQFLLALERSAAGGRTRLLTYWGAYQPTFGRARNGRVYFRKTK